MDKRFWGVLVAIALVLTGIFVATNHKANAPSDTSSGTLTNHTFGEGKSGVRLVEYGDFQCPACGQFYPLVKQVKEKYKQDITFQFRNFPLFQIHPNAIASARAAEAADKQGKFWEMHDLLYENQQAWSTSTNPQTDFEQYARQLSLNIDKFKADFKSKSVNDRIQADLREGNKLGVDSTPTFFIDNKKISNPNTLEEFSKVIENAIQQKTGQKPSSSATSAQSTTETGSGGGSSDTAQ